MRAFTTMSIIGISASALILVSPDKAVATSIVPASTWENDVLNSDFVGVVECQIAGGITARFRVVETWKGSQEEDSVVTLRQERAAPQFGFPVFLCGQRFVAFASKKPRQRDWPSGPIGWQDPVAGHNRVLWRRNIPADYASCMFMGNRPILNDLEVWVDGGYQDIQPFRETIKATASYSPEELEAWVLKSFCRAYLTRDHGWGEIAWEIQHKNGWRYKALIALDPTESIEDILQVFVDAWNDPQRELSLGLGVEGHLQQIIAYGGGKASLAVLERIEGEFWQKLATQLRRRLDPSEDDELKEPLTDEKPTDNDLLKLRSVLTAGVEPGAWRFNDAFDRLSRFEPETVLKYLLRWTDSEEQESIGGGYALGSYFGQYCGLKRAEYYKSLTEASDEFIKVASAIYLSLEDEASGIRYLEQFSQLEGDPGVWAALNLARRGRKDAMPRVMQVFDTPTSEMTSFVHMILQSRVLVLLSNSCRASGIPMPSVAYGESPGRVSPSAQMALSGPFSRVEARQRNLDWWTANQDRIVPQDPWLEVLKAQKID